MKKNGDSLNLYCLHRVNIISLFFYAIPNYSIKIVCYIVVSIETTLRSNDRRRNRMFSFGLHQTIPIKHMNTFILLEKFLNIFLCYAVRIGIIIPQTHINMLENGCAVVQPDLATELIIGKSFYSMMELKISFLGIIMQRCVFANVCITNRML